MPSMLIAMMEDKSFASRDLSHLKRIIVGGAPVPMELLKRCEDAFSASVTNSYGQTESSGVITSTTPADSAERKTQSCGRPLPGVSLKVIGADQKITETGRPGELCYKGPGLMLGYLDADATSATIDSEGWLHTGDLGYLVGNELFISGRKKDLIISGGFNVYPQMIEQAIYTHPSVEEVLVIGVPDSYRGESAKAFVKLREGAEPLTLEALNAFLDGKIGRHEMPRELEIRQFLPRTNVGKLSKKELRDEAFAAAKTSK